ncbi:hypothetical protein BDFG_07738 [Blastomyces dermatitidis ATCC 26199]|uniref:Alpha-ketoglutarate-dependent dioxygenase AlkB-like domain-containing protein n=1 Tax=[Emmonsia] crescens TaxID=73230 RepID=A0A0G2I8X1_9EURO|nr:hypothetical protein BDFG_07738 [Blastomyces dermatitidis ATCC 26199]KKZ66958.1 hypothetical protein EMCG_07350 [Emmonsia crescens UAMH 3008]
MAPSLGYEIIRNAVPVELVEKVANALQAPKHRREKYDAYEVPPPCYEIRDKFLKDADKSALVKFFEPQPVPPHLDHIFVGIFRETEPNPEQLKTANENEIYVTIALTNLNSKSGWYTFYEGSRTSQAMTSLASWSTVSLDLKPGDAVIWRGDLLYLHSAGGGGVFQTLVYKKL